MAKDYFGDTPLRADATEGRLRVSDEVCAQNSCFSASVGRLWHPWGYFFAIFLGNEWGEGGSAQ